MLLNKLIKGFMSLYALVYDYNGLTLSFIFSLNSCGNMNLSLAEFSIMAF